MIIGISGVDVLLVSIGRATAKVFQPGSVGDKDYSPVVRVLNAGDHIYDAPIVPDSRN